MIEMLEKCKGRGKEEKATVEIIKALEKPYLAHTKWVRHKFDKQRGREQAEEEKGEDELVIVKKSKGGRGEQEIENCLRYIFDKYKTACEWMSDK